MSTKYPILLLPPLLLHKPLDSMAMAFWGVEVKPGELYNHQPSPGRRLRISQATLGTYDVVGWSILQCSVGDMRPVRLCTLDSTTTTMRYLDLEYEEKENFTLSVLGTSSTHLSGYYICLHNADHHYHSEKTTGEAIIHTCLKRKCQGGDTDCKHDGSLMKPIICEDGEFNGDTHPPTRMASSNKTAKKRKTIEEVPNDQIDGMGWMEEKGDPTDTEYNAVHIMPTKAHNITREGNAHQNADQAENNAVVTEVPRYGGTDQIIKKTDLVITISEGATSLQDVGKQIEEAVETAHAEEDAIKETTDTILKIEDLGCADAKMSSDHNKIPSSATKMASQCLKSKHQGGHADGKNDASPVKPAASEGDDDSDHRPITIAFSKRSAREMKKCKLLSAKQVNKPKDCGIMESNTVHIAPTTSHEIAREEIALQTDGQKQNASEIGGQHDGAVIQKNSPTIMICDKGSLGAANLQGYEEAKEVYIHKKVLDNGLVIEDLILGHPNAKRASNKKEVSVKYVGMLEDGKAVDPIEGSGVHKFILGTKEVVLGWDLGIHGMRVGGKRRLTIPPALGYGKKGSEEKEIPENSWLIYEVELTEVKRLKKGSQASVNCC